MRKTLILTILLSTVLSFPFNTQTLCKEKITKTTTIRKEKAKTGKEENKKYYKCKLTKQEQDYIRKVANENDLDFELVMKLIKTESNFTKNLRSKTADSGLMQINDCNKSWLKRDLKLTNMMDFRQNVQAGCYILGNLKEKYKDDHKALMAYNRGEGGARSLWRKGIYQNVYSKKVMGQKLTKM